MRSAGNNGWLLGDVSNLMLAALYFKARYMKKQNKTKQSKATFFSKCKS